MRDEKKTREAPNQPNSSYQTETHVVSTSLNLPESPHEQGYIHGNPTGETGPPPQTSQSKGWEVLLLRGRLKEGIQRPGMSVAR
jgi:hypothetical protein